MKRNETKRMIWTSDLYADESAIKDWWYDECRNLADSADYGDLCRELGIDPDELTDAQITALNSLLPLYRERIMEREPDMRLWAEENADWLEDERGNLDMPLCGCVVAIEDEALWNKRKTIFFTCGSNLNSILRPYKPGDYDSEYFADDYEVRSNHLLHDGTNRVLYRFATAAQHETLLRLSEAGKLTEKAFLRNTTSLLPYVAAVYGWTLRNAKQREKAQRIAEEERRRRERRRNAA